MQKVSVPDSIAGEESDIRRILPASDRIPRQDGENCAVKEVSSG